MKICNIKALGREFTFLLDSDVDHIQNVIRSGQFYELDELELIAKFARRPKRILDVGANIGNHSVYFAHCFAADLVVPVEPNPVVTPLLRANLALNWHPSFDLSQIGTGFSDRPGLGVSNTKSLFNLGGATLQESDNGRIPIVTGDAALPEHTFDLIKIDVEGMEFAVINGMSQILKRSEALVFLEVLIQNIDGAIALMRDVGYEYSRSYQRYGRCINLLFEKFQ